MAVFARKGNNMSLDKKVKDKVVSAYIPESEYGIYVGFTKKKQERFMESIKNFKAPNNLVNHCIDLGRIGLKPQEEYGDVPFRDEKYDSSSTVATAGSAIIIAKFLEQTFGCEEKLSIEELAELAVAKGYRGYKIGKDGTYESNGCKHIFWEKFISSLYGLESKRALSVRDMLNGLWDYKLSVILLSEGREVEKKAEDVKAAECAEKAETGSRFVLMTGFNRSGITFFDPVVCRAVHKNYTEILPYMRAAWIIGDEEDYYE